MFEKDTRLCRLIRPANPPGRVNVYSQFTKRTTTFGLIILATVINKIWGWRVEVIDEENYCGPTDKSGLPDHKILQQENHADVVGFYCGLTSTIERVWDLAAFYKSHRAITLAGSWHAHYCPEETLRHNIDLVVHGDAEKVIVKVFENIDNGQLLYEDVGGVSYMLGQMVQHATPDREDAGEIPDCDLRLVELENRLTCEELSRLPYPDFGLMKCAKIKIYPIGRIRGCRMKCKFCTVKTNPHWANPKWQFGMVDWLVKTRNAQSFFIVDDRSEEDLSGTIDFFNLIAQRFGKKLNFTVQMRLAAAENTELMNAMESAGVRSVCIGLESPIEEELVAMKKGNVAQKMIDLIAIWRKHMRVHGMFIFGFPVPGFNMLIAKRVKIFKNFIKKAGLDYVQVVLPVPLPGSELRNEYEAQGKLFPLSVAPWRMYDGNFLLIKLEPGVDSREFQSAHIKIMSWFYGAFRFPKVIYRTLTFPADYFLRGWEPWYSDWGHEIILWIGHKIVRRWKAAEEDKKHLKKIENYLD